MGLLGDYLPDWLPADQDKAEAARMGLLNFGAAMMANANRGFGGALGYGLHDGAQAYQTQYKANLDQKRENLQMDLLKQQVSQATRKNGLINDMLQQYGGGGTPAATGGAPAMTALTQGAAVGDIGPTVTNAARIPAAAPVSGLLGKVPREAIAHDLAFNDGKNIAEWLYKQGTPDMQVSNGYAYDRNDVKPGFMPQLSMSQDGKASMVTVGPDGRPVVSAPTGALPTFSAFKNAEKRADANYTLLPLNYADRGGHPIGGTVGAYIDSLGSPTPAPAAPPPAQPGAEGLDTSRLTPQQIGYLQKKNPEAYANGVTKFASTTGGAPALQSEAEKTAQIGEIQGRQGTQNKINENWINTFYNPVVQGGQDAVAAKNNITALRNIDLKTGSGAETKAAMANFLTGIGIAPDNAKLYATNYQRFQSVAMDSLINKFAAQKGQQTEGDAKRVASTYAQVSNTPDANRFIADFAEANANMAARKAAFYQAALPIAQKEGDLTKVDREWQKIQGSIWDDPLMARWSKK